MRCKVEQLLKFLYLSVSIQVGCNNGAKRCPTCNKKACLKDIRILYLPKVVPLDTVERDRLIQEKEEVSSFILTMI